jgi:hypothetical protein
MSQTVIGSLLLAVPLLLAIVYVSPFLWAWWRDYEAGRLAVAVGLWCLFTWREAVMLAPYYGPVDRIDSTLAGLAFLALLYANGWLAAYVSLLPRYWRAQRFRNRTWQEQLFDNYRL